MLELKDISYSINNKIILNNISLNILKGDIVGLIGESGAGKTTLSKIVANVLTPTSGIVLQNDIRPTDIQILFQNNLELINPLRKVSSILDDAKSISNNKDDLNSFIKDVGLEESIIDKYGYQLSGGERQRIALARILIVSPKLLILDEPFSAQDSTSQSDLVTLFQKLNSNLGITILCVSHDLNIMSNFPSKLGVMKDGELIEFGETSEVVNIPKHNYTKFLFKANNFQLGINDFDLGY